jgi:hypothetical protein
MAGKPNPFAKKGAKPAGKKAGKKPAVKGAKMTGKHPC